MPYTIEIKETAAQAAAVVPFTASVSEMGDHLGKAFDAVMQAIQEAGVEIAGPPFAYYEQLGNERFNVHAGFPVSAPIAGSGEVEPFDLPAGPIATTMHVGSYSKLGEAYTAIEEYARAQGYDIDTKGPAWEEYLSEPETPPEQTQTIVHWPVKQK